MRRVLIGLVFTLCGVFLAAPAPAADQCDRFGREFAMFQDEHNDAMREFNRVEAMNPKPAKDVALCRAMRKFLNDNVYFLNADTNHLTCFQNAQEAKDFSGVVHKWGDGAASLIGFFCTDEELRRPVKSKVNECVPNC